MADAPSELPDDLECVGDTMPGLCRRRTRSGFRYVDATGTPVRDERELPG
jgi:hypothetical protein